MAIFPITRKHADRKRERACGGWISFSKADQIKGSRRFCLIGSGEGAYRGFQQNQEHEFLENAHPESSFHRPLDHWPCQAVPSLAHTLHGEFRLDPGGHGVVVLGGHRRQPADGVAKTLAQFRFHHFEDLFCPRGIQCPEGPPNPIFRLAIPAHAGCHAPQPRMKTLFLSRAESIVSELIVRDWSGSRIPKRRYPIGWQACRQGDDAIKQVVDFENDMVQASDDDRPCGSQACRIRRARESRQLEPLASSHEQISEKVHGSFLADKTTQEETLMTMSWNAEHPADFPGDVALARAAGSSNESMSARADRIGRQPYRWWQS